MINRKGLSAVVTTVLIVLLALAAVAIVWGFIQPAIEGAGTSVDIQNRCLSAEVKPRSCTVIPSTVDADVTGASVVVQYVKGQPDKYKVILEDADGEAEVSNSRVAPPTLLATDTMPTGQFNFTTPILDTDTIKAKVVVVFDSRGDEIVCSNPSPTVVGCTRAVVLP